MRQPRTGDDQAAFRFAVVWIIVSIVGGCVALTILASHAHGAVIPTPEQRQRNRVRGLYCVPASVGTMFDTMGKPKSAAWIRAYAMVRGSKWHGGMKFDRLADRLRGLGLSVAAMYDGDAAFLETVDLAVVNWEGIQGGHHAVLFCGYIGDMVIISDPQSKRLEVYTKANFIAFWQRCHGGAVAIKPLE